MGILVLIAFLPSSRAFSGRVVPKSMIGVMGYTDGTLNDIRYEDNNVVTFTGAWYWWQEFKIMQSIYFPIKTDVGGGNELEMEFSFSGGGVLQVLIRYLDYTYDIYYESNTGMKTVIYDLDDNKAVHYVRLFNHEWWFPGIVKVDYMEVNY